MCSYGEYGLVKGTESVRSEQESLRLSQWHFDTLLKETVWPNMPGINIPPTPRFRRACVYPMNMAGTCTSVIFGTPTLLDHTLLPVLLWKFCDHNVIIFFGKINRTDTIFTALTVLVGSQYVHIEWFSQTGRIPVHRVWHHIE